MFYFRPGFIFVLVALSACFMNENENTIEVAHPNGLSLRLPESVSVEQTFNGFFIIPRKAKELRTPFEIEVSLHADERPEGEWPEMRQIKGDTVYYRIDRIGGGSGGDIYVLNAWKAYPTGYVLLRHYEQGEDILTPDFALGWIVISSTRAIRKKGK
jgi:hypothetical protein